MAETEVKREQRMGTESVESTLVCAAIYAPFDICFPFAPAFFLLDKSVMRPVS